MQPEKSAHSSYRLEPVTSLEVMDQIFRLRVDAWRTNLDIPSDVSVWRDRFDDDAQHWAFFDGDKPIAAGRLTISPTLSAVPDSAVYCDVLPSDLKGPIGALTRLVISPAYRGKGLARHLDNVRITAARLAGCTCVIGWTHEKKRFMQLQTEGFEVHASRHAITEESGIVAGLLPNAIVILRLSP
jgi:GNAT superfamily N-acetyltransferase